MPSLGHLGLPLGLPDDLVPAVQDVLRVVELARERRAALITAAVTGQIEIPTED